MLERSSDRGQAVQTGHQTARQQAGPAAALEQAGDVAALLQLQRAAGNGAVGWLLSARGAAGATPALPVLTVQRDPPPPSGDSPLGKDDPDYTELIRLNGLPMDALLVAVDGADRGKLRPKIRSAWGVNFERMELAFSAAEGKGTASMDFAFSHYTALRKLGFRDQRDAVLRFVDPGFQPPRKLEPGDTLHIDGLLAIVHRGHIRKQRSKADGLPWIAYNPGAVGNAPAWKSPGGYGKTIGPASINIYASEPEGMAGLTSWVQFNADRKVSFAGFFKIHAPAPNPAMGAAAKGNDPLAYFNRVARQLGLDPGKPGVATMPLAGLNAGAVARAITAVGEGYARGGDTLTWPADEARLDRATWFAIMYWETEGPGAFP